MFTKGHVPTHRGKITTTDPIRGDDIQRVRQHLQQRPRDLALWSVGTNTALRAGDIVALCWSDIEDDGERMTLLVKEQKTSKVRRIVLNPAASADLRQWRECSGTSGHVFTSQRGGALTVAAVGRMIKHVAREAGVSATRVSSHSLRKTWVRAHADRGVPLHRLMWALGHSSERQTAAYCGLLVDEVAELYEHVV